MTSTQWHRPAAVGIALEATVLTGAIAMDGTAQTSTTSIPTTVDQHDDQLIVGTGQALLPSAARSDVLERLGERRLIPIRDTYYEAVDVLTVLLTAMRSDAEGLAGVRISATAIAHPALWDRRKRDLLERAARTADFTHIDLVAAPIAASWAPVDGRPTLPEGVLLILDLESDRTVNASLLEPDGRGFRLIGSAIVPGEVRLRETLSGLLTTAGRRWADIDDARAVGAGATDSGRIRTIESDLDVQVRVPDRPTAAVAIGAAHRWLAHHAPPTPPRLPADADITARLAEFAADCDAHGDHERAGIARQLGQEIYQFRMRIHPPAPAGAEAVVLNKAEALVATSPGGS